MDKKYILITGISSGIGLDACRFLIEKGFTIIGTVRKQEDKTHLLGRFPSNLHVLIYDVRDFEAIERSVSQVRDILGDNKLYGLINNAGIAVPGPLSHLDDESFENQIRINLLSVRKVTNAYLDFMHKNDPNVKSRIIFMSSISGLFAAPFNGAYCISKHALECMVDIYRRELKLFGIEVVAIQPGPIKTQIWAKNKGSFDQYRNSPYADIAAKVDKVIEATEADALPVEVISRKIYQILESAHPGLRYLIHKHAFMFKVVSKYLPTRMVDKLIWKNLNKKNMKTYRPV